RRDRLRSRWGANDLIYLVIRRFEVPPTQLANQDQPVPRAALAAEVTSAAVAVIEAVPILTAAQRAGSVLVCQEARLDPEQRPDFAPSAPGALDCLAAHERGLGGCDFAQAMFRDRIHARVASEGDSAGP